MAWLDCISYLNLWKLERLRMLNDLKQKCKSYQNYKFILCPNRLFLLSLSILTQILPTDCLWSKAVQRPEQSYEAKCQPLLKCLVWFICSLRLPLYPKYAFDRNNAVTLNHVSRSKWINVKADLFQNQFWTLSPWPNLAQRSMSNSNSLQRSMSNSNF